MKNKLLTIALIAMSTFSFAQQGRENWTPGTKKANAVTIGNKTGIGNPRLFELDANSLQQLFLT